MPPFPLPLAHPLRCQHWETAGRRSSSAACRVVGKARQAVATAYGHLWHVNNESAAPFQFGESETAAYEARKPAHLLTNEERDKLSRSWLIARRYVFWPRCGRSLL